MRRIAVLALLVACPGPASDTDTDPVDTGDTGDTGDAPVSWEVAPISDTLMGSRPRLEATPSGGLWAVSFATVNRTSGALCDSGAERTTIDLILASYTGGAWTEEVIASPYAPLEPTGVALAVDDAGEPWVAWAAGEPLPTWCGGHDLVLRAPDGGLETVVEESGEAATGMPASDAGSVVGLWPDLAFDPDGDPALAYRDAHFGALQRDDRYRSDAELARRTAGWQHEAVDAGAGAGDHNRVVFDSEGRAFVATVLPIIKQGEDRQGVWVARETSEGWETARVVEGVVDDHLDMIALPDGGVAVATYVPDDGSAVLLRHDGGPDWSSWQRTFIARDGWIEGENIALDLTADGRIVAALHTCARLGADEGSCDRGEEGPSLAVENARGGFDIERIHSHDAGACGRELDVAVVDDVAHVVFRCTTDTGTAFRDELWHAVRGEAL